MDNRDYVGNILLNVFAFRNSDFNPHLKLNDEITGEKVAAATMFMQIHGRWHLRPASLPGYSAICAVAIDANTLFIEAEPFDAMIFNKVMAENGMAFTHSQKTRRITSKKGLVILVSLPQTFQVENMQVPARCLCQVKLTQLKDHDSQDQVAALFDTMFTRSVFHTIAESPEDPHSTPAVEPSIRMELSMRLVHSLELVQRPILSLNADQQLKPEANQEATQTLQLQHLFALQRQIGQMSRDELNAFTTKFVADRGELVVLKAYSFIAAGRIKRIKPNLTWKQARLVADRIILQLT